ncbi:rhomboid family intramembrane serine protease [Marinimicrobium agarilyticum]|uniref:rhomboid family intramembrane serine protease n=1 Tax=Marinimicrobium agarilyticum TaxID=306546 RepID=UPI000421225F|nr:rhomboid family intramembrane serine protease [Marinimicrobium agarilyticum]
MFIIPIQNKPDWSRPPVITLALILINLLVFVFYQGLDEGKRERAIETYRQLELSAIERPHYTRYLQQEKPEAYERWKAITESASEPLSIAPLVVQDISFDAYLRDIWREREAGETETWQRKRREFEAERNTISVLQAGLIPADPEPLDFITSLFLHGGWGHLLGNMAFLFLFGFILESALRPSVYVAMYLAAGLAADGLFLVFNMNSVAPVVGASGAISGLMGMYLALYGFRRIRFFYNVLFYFGEFTAPALWVFPAWLAKEFYGYLFVESNTAYWAHIGGLLAGSAMVLALPQSRQRFAQKEQDAEREDTLNQKLRDVQTLVANLDVEQARRRTELLCKHYPNDPRPWETLFDLHKTQPSKKAFHQAAFSALRAFCQNGDADPHWPAMIKELLGEYRSLSPNAPALTGDLSLMLSRRFWMMGERSYAETYLKRALERNAKPQPLANMVHRVYQHYQKSTDITRTRQWQEALQRLSEAPRPKPDSEPR